MTDAIDTAEAVARLDDLAEVCDNLTTAVDRLLETGIDRRILCLLVKEATPGTVKLRDIDLVLSGMEALSHHVFPVDQIEQP